jgi:hypothetical protein
LKGTFLYSLLLMFHKLKAFIKMVFHQIIVPVADWLGWADVLRFRPNTKDQAAFVQDFQQITPAVVRRGQFPGCGSARGMQADSTHRGAVAGRPSRQERSGRRWSRRRA